jgi:hypothetical protein
MSLKPSTLCHNGSISKKKQARHMRTCFVVAKEAQEAPVRTSGASSSSQDECQSTAAHDQHSHDTQTHSPLPKQFAFQKQQARCMRTCVVVTNEAKELRSLACKASSSTQDQCLSTAAHDQHSHDAKTHSSLPKQLGILL